MENIQQCKGQISMYDLIKDLPKEEAYITVKR